MDERPLGKTRAVHQKMSPDDKKALVEILRRPDVKVNGKISIAVVSKLTGLSYAQVYGFTKKNPYLAAQLAEAEPSRLVPKETDQIDTALDPAVGVTISNAQFEEYRAMIRQSRKMLAADWEKLGMTEEAGKRMEHYAAIGMAPTSGVLRIATGQLISNLELLDRVIKGDFERVLADNLPSEKMKNGEERPKEEVERDWRYMIFAGVKLQLDMFSHMHKVQALMARVMTEMRKANGGQAPVTKGQFEMQVATTPATERSA